MKNRTILEVAAEFGYLDVVRTMVEANADISPLQAAICSNVRDPELVIFLANKGANLTIKVPCF